MTDTCTRCAAGEHEFCHIWTCACGHGLTGTGATIDPEEDA